jgi:polyhydroxyalkanoate synthase subunit PhaC
MAQTNLPRRLGPRPLPLHLGIATATWLGSAAALTLLSGVSKPSKGANGAENPKREPLRLASLPWHADVNERAKALEHDLQAVDPDQFTAAVGREVRRRLDEFETGLRVYRLHPAHRVLDEVPSVWQDGTTRLLDYSTATGGRPLLVIPSLINRAYVLDLSARRSLMRFLAGAGFRPYMVDWGRPGEQERGFSLSNYIARLAGALDVMRKLTPEKPAVIGYCMGGLLALALAQARQADLAGLALLATPWDFHADRAPVSRALAASIEPSLPLIDRMGEMPVDLLQLLFTLLDPFLAARKFRGLARVDPSSDHAAEFVALEDWINDGVPLAAAVARECLVGWYGANTPGRGEWRVSGTAIRPEMVTVPSLVVVPEQDRIVPPESAAALANALPNATVLRPPLGHIGMVVGSRARKALWEPLARWLAAGRSGRL